MRIEVYFLDEEIHEKPQTVNGIYAFGESTMIFQITELHSGEIVDLLKLLSTSLENKNLEFIDYDTRERIPNSRLINSFEEFQIVDSNGISFFESHQRVTDHTLGLMIQQIVTAAKNKIPMEFGVN